MTYKTYTQQLVKEQAQTLAPEELTSVEISFFDHEIYAHQKLIARIAYDSADFVTQRWVVMVNGEEIFRAIAYMKCHDYITWHYKQKTLPVQEPETPTTTTDNEVIVQIADECDKLGLELLDNGIYNNDQNLGQVGCTNGQWWVKRASSIHQQKVLCNSVMNAVLSLLIDEAVSCEELLDKPFDQLTAEEWRMLLEYEPAPENRELVAA